MKYTLLALAAICGVTASAQTFLQDLSSIDAHALNAVQLTFNGRYGPGSHPGTADCPSQKSTSTGYCLAVVNFNVPTGKRLVIENVSVTFTFNPNGNSNVIFSPQMSIGTNVSNTIAFTSLPFDNNVSSGGATGYFMSKSLRLYADPATGFPEITFTNFVGPSIGPDLGPATGFFTITLSGYYVSTN